MRVYLSVYGVCMNNVFRDCIEEKLGLQFQVLYLKITAFEEEPEHLFCFPVKWALGQYVRI